MKELVHRRIEDDERKIGQAMLARCLMNEDFGKILGDFLRDKILALFSGSFCVADLQKGNSWLAAPHQLPGFIVAQLNGVQVRWHAISAEPGWGSDLKKEHKHGYSQGKKQAGWTRPSPRQHEEYCVSMKKDCHMKGMTTVGHTEYDHDEHTFCGQTRRKEVDTPAM